MDKPLSKEDVLKTLDPYILDLVDVVLTGWASWVKHSQLRPEVHPHLHIRTRASYVHDEIWRLARTRFIDNDVQPSVVGDVNFLKFSPTIWVRFKKLDEKGKPRNYPTNQAKAFSNDSNQLEFFPGTRDSITPTVFVLGYRLDASGTQPNRVLLVKMYGSAVEWKHPLYDRTEGLVHELPVEDKPTPKPVVLPKKDEEKHVEEK